MGRGDGTGRMVSPEGADDTGTGILHVDMDAFYASVEVLDDPSLRGKPIIIGAPDSRSVVSSASYEARRFGVRSAMPVGQALRLCPTAIVVLPHFDRYLELSAQVMRIFHSVTPLVEPLSIDEAFLDVRGARRLLGGPGEIAWMLRRRVLEETGLTCSVGVASTKHVAKMASTVSKPDGVLVVAEADTAAFLASRPVRALWGIGPKSAESLESRGIHTVADVLDTPRAHPRSCARRCDGRSDLAPRARLGCAAGRHDARGEERRSRGDIPPRHRRSRHPPLRVPSPRRSRGSQTQTSRLGSAHDRDQSPLHRLHDHQPVADPARAHCGRAEDRRSRARAVRCGRAHLAGAARRGAGREAAPIRPDRTDSVGRRCRVATRGGRARRRDREVRPRRGDACDPARRGARGRHLPSHPKQPRVD